MHWPKYEEFAMSNQSKKILFSYFQKPSKQSKIVKLVGEKNEPIIWIFKTFLWYAIFVGFCKPNDLEIGVKDPNV